MNQHKVFEEIVRTLRESADQTAFVDRHGARVSYREFGRKITGTRAVLEQRGVRKGTKVLVFVPMSVELYVVLEALFSLGAAAVFLDPWMKGRKMGEVIRQVQPDLIIVTRRIAVLLPLLPATWRLKKWVIGTLPENNDPWRITPVKDEEDALITFTSGTGGRPKGANRTFGFLQAQSAALGSHLRSEARQIDYTNFPIVALASLAQGNTVVLPHRSLMKIHAFDPLEVASQLRQAGVTRMMVSPALLTRAVEGMMHVSCPALKEVVTGGAPVSSSLIAKCLEHFPEVHFDAIYGSTEAEPIALAGFEFVATQMKNPFCGIPVGRPVPEIRVRIAALHEGPLSAEEVQELPAGGIGEIQVTGNHVNKSYFHNPEAFSRHKIVEADGTVWHRTGDVGYLHEGFLYLVGRENRILERDGKCWHPYPVEQAVEQRFGYRDIGFVCRKDGKFVFFVGGGQQVDRAEMMNFLKTHTIPCDEICVWQQPLPRDARHRSKLHTEELL